MGLCNFFCCCCCFSLLFFQRRVFFWGSMYARTGRNTMQFSHHACLSVEVCCCCCFSGLFFFSLLIFVPAGHSLAQNLSIKGEVYMHIQSEREKWVERVGDFVVMSYHDVSNAASLHEQFKRLSIDAAVIDSAYIVSRLHLAVALHRIMDSPFVIEPSGDVAHAAATERVMRTARDVFAAVSHTRNLDRVMRRLTCGETTRAIVVVLHAPSSEHVKVISESVRGLQHGLSSLATYCDKALVQDFYGISDAEMGAVTLEVAVVNRLVTCDI